jgi:hypothetical protein
MPFSRGRVAFVIETFIETSLFPSSLTLLQRRAGRLIATSLEGCVWRNVIDVRVPARSIATAARLPVGCSVLLAAGRATLGMSPVGLVMGQRWCSATAVAGMGESDVRSAAGRGLAGKCVKL